jgi:hypothetical protein
MSIINYPANSPYSATPQSNFGIGLFVFKPIPPDAGDLPYTLLAQHQYRPDRLSYDLYNTPNYWWVFAARNPRLRANILFDFLPGLTIIIPSAEYVRKVAGN